MDTVAQAKWLLLLEKTISSCQRCSLYKQRKNPVLGEGNIHADLMFVGEGPGAEEDQQGRPFVGRAGKRLDLWIQDYLGMKREDVYIANTVKCRPPGNRVPTMEEIGMCFPYLLVQISFIKPKVIVALGKTAAQDLLGLTKVTSLKRLRIENPYRRDGYYVVVTYHPAAVLRNISYESAVRDDLIIVRDLLEVS